MILFSPIRIRKQRFVFSVSILLFIGLLFGLIGFEYADELDMAALDNDTTALVKPIGTIKIEVKVQERVLELLNNGEIYKKYRIAVGKSSTPSPIGEWNIVWKDYNWGTGFGTRWMGLNVPWGVYGIHGTNKPWSIGQFASHGCIRLRNKDVEELFEWVPIGTPVKIEGRVGKIQRVLKYQSTGPDVVILQLKLKELGYLEGRADGIYGKSTEDAIRHFQQDKGEAVTGVASKMMTDLLGI